MKCTCWPSMSVRKCGQRLKRSSCAAPVELRLPVVAQLLEIRQVGAVVPTAVRDLIGPARTRQPVAEIVEHRVGHLDAERSQLVSHAEATAAVATLARAAAAALAAAAATCAFFARQPHAAHHDRADPAEHDEQDRQQDPEQTGRTGLRERPFGIAARVDRGNDAEDESDQLHEQHDPEKPCPILAHGR